MQQTAKNSQTSRFANNKSQTTNMLFQQPKVHEQRPSLKAQIKADLKDFAIVTAVFVIPTTFICMKFLGA